MAELVKKEIDYKGEVFTFFLDERKVVNEREFNRLIQAMMVKLLAYCRAKYWQIPSYEVGDLYEACLSTVNSCIYTFNNDATARTTKRASFNTYFWNIMRGEFENRRVVQTKERTVKNLISQEKTFEASAVWNIVGPMSFEDFAETETPIDCLTFLPVNADPHAKSWEDEFVLAGENGEETDESDDDR